MITKTLNLDQAYQKLFDDVRTASNGQYSFDNLEAFYGSIEEVAGVDPKFLRLPLDEPLFEIDANTRKITVPAEFRANGVSVQRDHLAEVIYFRIARFFDYTDLSTCEIVINWKMGANEGKTTRFIQFNEPFTVDEVETNGIIFGWPINNIVTEKSGQLTFAVEFFKKEGDEIIYRFNTLPTTVNIKDGLVIDEEATVYELDNDIIRTLINSSFGDGEAAVGPVVWLTGDGQGLVVGKEISVDSDVRVMFEDFAPIVNLRTEINEQGVPVSIPVDFYAQGFIDENTSLRYTSTEGSNNIPVVEFVKVFRPRVQEAFDSNSGKKYYLGEFEFEPANSNEINDAIDGGLPLWVDGALIDELKYYVVDSTNPLGYSEATQTQKDLWGKVDCPDLYTKAARIEANTANSYAIKAQGYKEGYKRDPETGEYILDENDNKVLEKIGNGEVKSTAVVEVPMPEQPSAINMTVSQLTDNDIPAGYSFADNIQNVVFLSPQGNSFIEAEAVVDNYGAMQFTWQKKVGMDAHNEPIFTNLSQTNPFNVDTIVDDELHPANKNSLTVTEAGDYQVQVVNFLNGNYAETATSSIITASALASVIQSATAKYKRAMNNNAEFAVVTDSISYNSSNFTPTNVKPYAIILKVDDVVIANGEQEGSVLEYQWFKKVWNNEGGENGEGADELIPIENATSAELGIVRGDGKFVAVIKNNFNGSIYTYQLSEIIVNDDAT